MNRRKEITDELNDAAPLLEGIDLQHPYRVPAGYFEDFAERILLRIRLENAGSAQEELEIISPLLSGLSKQMPFSTPEGYFDTLIPEIHGTKTVVERKPARVVKMFQPQKTFRMAAVAVTIGVISFAAWLFLREPSIDQYATKTDTEVQKELKSKVSELSDNELADFIESSTVLTTYDSTSLEDISEDDVKLMLADISDQELEKFVDQNSVKEKYN